MGSVSSASSASSMKRYIRKPLSYLEKGQVTNFIAKKDNRYFETALHVLLSLPAAHTQLKHSINDISLNMEHTDENCEVVRNYLIEALHYEGGLQGDEVYPM